MLNDEEKNAIQESACFIAILNEVTGSIQDWPNHIKYAIEKGKPIYVVRERGYTVLDHLLNGAKIMGGIEYDGKPDSEEHKQAQATIMDLIRYHFDSDDVEFAFTEYEEVCEYVPVHIARFSDN